MVDCELHNFRITYHFQYWIHIHMYLSICGMKWTITFYLITNFVTIFPAFKGTDGANNFKTFFMFHPIAYFSRQARGHLSVIADCWTNICAIVCLQPAIVDRVDNAFIFVIFICIQTCIPNGKHVWTCVFIVDVEVNNGLSDCLLTACYRCRFHISGSCHCMHGLGPITLSTF